MQKQLVWSWSFSFLLFYCFVGFAGNAMVYAAYVHIMGYFMELRATGHPLLLRSVDLIT